MKIQAKRRGDFPHFEGIDTRWMDNDVYGHVNNVVYYSWFDTAVNRFLATNGALDILHGAVIGLVIETQCNYFSPVAFPDRICVGVGVAKLGNSSVRYDVGIFQNDAEIASAQGHFVHVYVDRETRKPTALPVEMRNLLNSIQIHPK
ncbi:MAG: thioesterase family protein [Burkholderiaceae bacterium]|nr:thioesterase family protein [Burkholderiaceae bacterium]